MLELSAIYSDYTIRSIALGTGLLGFLCGITGTFALLKKESLLGDAISHAALPGIVMIFILTGIKETYVLLLGALIAGLIATFLIGAIVKQTKIKSDAALGIILSSFFGFGLLLLSHIQKTPGASQAGLDKFLFGQAATMVEEDIYLLLMVCLPLLGLIALFWKEMKSIVFDGDFSASLGIPTRFVRALTLSLIVVTIVVGLQTVGAVLMSALIVAPAMAARFWSNRLLGMMLISGGIGAFSCVTGSVISSLETKMPTGALIVLCVSVAALFSLFFGRPNGIVYRLYTRHQNKRKLPNLSVLLSLYELSLQHPDVSHGHKIEVMELMHQKPIDPFKLTLLVRQGYAMEIHPDEWTITQKGIDEVERLINKKTS